MTELESHYGKLLGLPSEWKVVEVDLSLEAMRVEIRLEWAGGKQIACPECGEACRIYDLREVKWTPKTGQGIKV